MKRIAVISAILENPEENQKEFNQVVSTYKNLVRGRMGLPFCDKENVEQIAVIALTVVGTNDEINAFTGKLGKIPNATVKVALSKKEIHL